MSGTSTSGAGVLAQGSDAVTISGGALTINGTTASGSQAGIDTSASGNTITNNGSGTLTLNGTGGDRLGATIASPSGDVVISDTGAVTQSGGAITAANLLLSGAGSFALSLANTIGTIAANAGAVLFNNNQALTIGTVQGTTGIAATGAVTVTAAGNLTIASTAQVAGASPVLATAAAFINSAGATAVNATAGRWLIYSSAPGSDNFGALNSANTAIWNATYASLPPANVTAAGNRYLFAAQPTLTFTSTNASKTYGTDATSLITGNYTIAGYQSAVASAFLSDSAANVFSGAPSVTSTGSAPGASVAGGPYTISVAQGALTALSGYAFSFLNNGQLTVNPAPVSVTALGGSSTYGSSPTNPGLSASGLQNGQNANVLTGLGNSFGITGQSNTGSYVLSVIGSLTNSNYTVAGTTNGSWTVNPASVSVTALGGASTFGVSPLNPGLSAAGLQNGQNVSVLTGLRNSFGITGSSSVGTHTLDVAGTLTNPNYTVASVSPGSWIVSPVPALRGSLADGSSHFIPGMSVAVPPTNGSLSALNGLAGASGNVDPGNHGSVGGSGRGASAAKADSGAPAGAGNAGTSPANPAPVVIDTPAAVAGASPNIAAASDPKAACRSGSAGGTGEACGPAAAPTPRGRIGFALTNLNRGALAEAINREFSEVTDFRNGPQTVLTLAMASTSLGLTVGIVSWLLRGGALLGALLSSMPLWREFDPLPVVMRPRRRDQEEQPPSDVDRLFDHAGARRPAARRAGIDRPARCLAQAAR